MILWHLGATIAIVRYVFRDPRMDLRWLALGALLPDLVDKPIGSVLFHGTFESDRIYAHALVFPVAVLAAVMFATRRGTDRRRAWLGLPIGSLLHLVLDGQWSNPEGFWWPLLGFEFPMRADSALWPLLVDTVTDPWVIAAEVVGGLYLAVLYRGSGLTNATERRRFYRTGRLPLPLPG